MAGYTRQSVADIVDGEDITAAPLNNEFNALQAAMHATTGHAHDASAGNGPKLVLTAAASVSGILPMANGGTGAALVDPGADRGMFWDDSAGALAFFTLPTGLTFSGTAIALANDLAALEAMSGTGIVTRTASETYAQRTLTGTSAEVTVTNGDGVSANPTISLPTALTFTGKTITGGTFTSPSFSGASYTYTYADDGAAEGPVLILGRVTTSPVANDLLGAVQFTGANISLDTKTFGEIYATATNVDGVSADGSLTFKTLVNDTRTTRLLLNEAGVTASGTLTATGGGSLTGTWTDLGTVSTVDINGGTIDNTVIGGSSAAAGTFTSLAVSSGNATFTYTDDGAGGGPNLNFYRVSASPAATDLLGYFAFYGKDSTAATTLYADMFARIIDPTNGAESGALYFRCAAAGSFVNRLILDNAGATVSGTLTASGGGSLTGTWSNLGTVTTVDINGGTVDGVAIGGSSASTGVFTTLRTTGNTRFGQNTTDAPGASNNTTGGAINSTGNAYFSAASQTVQVNVTSDGQLMLFNSGGTNGGIITVAGGTVAYGTFFGVHWSQLADGSKVYIPRGTIVESIDQKCIWEKKDDILPCFKVSDTPSSKKVYGVFAWWDTDGTNDAYIGALGTYMVRMEKGSVVEIGDLIESAGNGCGRVQEDDAMRSRTVAKIISSEVIDTYPDGSYTVSCSLHCG